MENSELEKMVSNKIVKQLRGTALAGLLAICILPQSILIEGTIASAVTLSVFSIMGLVFSIVIARNIITRSTIPNWLSQPPLFSIITVLVISTIYIGHVILGNYQDITNAISAIAIICVVALNIFIIPQWIPKQSFLSVLSRFSAALVISSFMILIIVSMGYLPSDLLWHDATTIANIRIPYLRSFTSNPNTVGQISFVGTVAAFYETDNEFSVRNLSLLITNSIGLFFTASQASWLATIVAFAIYIAYRYVGERGVSIIGLVLLSTSMVSLLVAVFMYWVGVGITLSGRLILWDATIQALQENLLFGYGHSPSNSIIRPYIAEGMYIGDATHNSYLRMALISGIIGGFSYLVLIFGSVYQRYRRRIDNIGIFSIACGFLVVQLFESYTIFGFTTHSVINALIIGYLLYDTEV